MPESAMMRNSSATRSFRMTVFRSLTADFKCMSHTLLLLPLSRQREVQSCSTVFRDRVYLDITLDKRQNWFSYITKLENNTSQQDFGTRKVYCVSNVTFHAESKYAIKIFPSPTVFVQWPF